MKYVSSFAYDPEGTTIISETDEKTKTTIYFSMDKTGEHSSRLTLEMYLRKNKVSEIGFNLFKKKQTEREFAQSLEQLDKVAKETIIPLEF